MGRGETFKMKKQFSTKWKASKQPRKQRKYVEKAPLHIKKKFVGINLSKELRKKYGKRTIPARKNDVIKVMRGKFRGKQGKIIRIKLKACKIFVEGIQVKKLDGSKADVPLKPSNLQIKELHLRDRKRKGTKETKKPEKSKKEVESKAKSQKEIK